MTLDTALAKRIEIAEAATKGPWYAVANSGSNKGLSLRTEPFSGTAVEASRATIARFARYGESDARHLAACSPDVIIPAFRLALSGVCPTCGGQERGLACPVCGSADPSVYGAVPNSATASMPSGLPCVHQFHYGYSADRGLALCTDPYHDHREALEAALTEGETG